MMNYEDFKNEVQEKIRDFLPQKYRDGKVEVAEKHHINRAGNMDMLGIVYEWEKEDGVRPYLCLNDMYAEYQETGNFRAVLMGFVQCYVEALEQWLEMDVQLEIDDQLEMDADMVRNFVVFQLVNTDRNREMLSGIPHREILDLSVIYRCRKRVGEHTAWCTITNDTAEDFGFSEEDLYRMAYENTRRLLPSALFDLAGSSPEAAHIPPGERLYAVSNSSMTYGAVNLLYEDMLKELADVVGTNLYVLPSSRHEVIALSVDARSAAFCRGMLKEVNGKEVEPDDWLSDQIYLYDKESQELTMVTDADEGWQNGIVDWTAPLPS